MPVTLPISTPANYSDPSITRAGLISGLNIVNVHAYNKFYETYGFVPYAALAQMAGQEEKAENKQFTWYQSRGRVLGFVTASAIVTVANNAPATITIAAGGYSQSGTKSLPALGMVFRNSRTGVDSKVLSVPNKSTPNAHTFILTPVVLGQNSGTLAGDELLERGQIYLGEQSDKTDTTVRNIDKYSNFCTQIRKDSTIGDLSDAEKIEFQINGKYSYTYKQMQDDNLALMQQLDLLIFEGTQTTNLPYAEEGTNGVIKQVQANGINGTYTTWGVSTTFAEIERALSSVGAAKEYDILSDTSSFIEQQNSIFTEINNGAIVYADNAGTRGGIDISRDFQSLKIYGRKYNFTNYGLFDEQKIYGSAGLGTRNKFSLFIPQGRETTTNDRGATVSVPRFTVMYQTPFNCNKWHVADNGLFADTPTSTKAERVMTTIGYFGARVIGAQQYMIYKG